ncbi:MAG: hypothetical protein ISN26_06360 [Betaproteobacteria bacterium AqS2]|uniref:Uncharacterized protein n=1 Tax=Candidatus Amphirhobacter heronislandensis TaxID=1732024 RepID=A0A930UD28_9GAMM|nr:hypothetical protein [Betaproteobacteria bacterium AqS2]
MAKQQPKTESFEGGLAGLLDYHHALHRLVCCLLAPPLAAASIHALWRLPGTGPLSLMAFLLLLTAFAMMFLSSSYAAASMSNAVVYASDGGPTAKSARLRSLWWRVFKIDFACCAGIATLMALLHALAGGLEPDLSLQTFQASLLMAAAIYPLRGGLLADRHGLGSRWWVLIGFAYVLVWRHLQGLGGPLALLPHMLGAALLLLGLSIQQQPLRSYLLANAFEIIFAATYIIWIAVIAETTILGIGWQGAAIMAVASAGATLAHHERIRRGLFTTDPEIIRRKSFAADKKSVARMINPLTRTPRYWKWARLVLRFAPRAWLVALASSIVAVTASLASL